MMTAALDDIDGCVACVFVCVVLYAGQVVSGDGNVVRLWNREDNRRIAMLQGHSGRVLATAFDDTYIVSGCSASQLRVWSMDDLKCVRTLRYVICYFYSIHSITDHCP